jgi:hypothetical protein
MPSYHAQLNKNGVGKAQGVKAAIQILVSKKQLQI